jgi:hypothetical protein
MRLTNINFCKIMMVDKFVLLQGVVKVSAIHPAAFYPELSNDRLRAIAVKLLDIRYSTFREMNSPFDDNYTRETAVFGRSRNMLIDLALSSQHDWMSLKHAAMDVTFNIGQVPCRFFRDDPNSPEKAGFFKRNAVDDLFATDEQYPVMWRFVVDKALTEDDEDRVFFVGYNVYQEKISEWMYRASAPTMHAVDKDVPAAAEIPPAFVDVREKADSANQGEERKTGSNE